MIPAAQIKMAKAAAAPAAAIKEESLVWPRTAAPVVAAADEADEAADEADEAIEEAEEPAVAEALAPVAVVVASVLVVVAVAVSEPVRVVSDAVLVVASAVEHERVLGRSVTPPRAQIPLAALRVAILKGVSRSVERSNTRGCWRHTLLLLRRALASNAAGHVVQERGALADASRIQAALLRECTSRA